MKRGPRGGGASKAMGKRILGWIFLCLAISVLGAELLMYMETGAYKALSLGGIWQNLHLTSYIQSEDLVTGKIWRPLWDPGIVTILACPAWVLLAAIAGLFFILSRQRRR